MLELPLLAVVAFALQQGSLPSALHPDAAASTVDATSGYARMPALRGNTLVFVAEGDLWRVDASGGRATRLTSHPGVESLPAISPDGTTLAFVASYEGPREVYTMPIDGGLPTRRTYDAASVPFVGWAPDGTLLYSTRSGTPIGSARLMRHDLATDTRAIVPLAQCADGAFLADESSLVFTRLEFQGSHTDRYKGGTTQQLWSFRVPPEGARGDEARLLTGDYEGTSKSPMVDLAGGDGRVYFISDRSGRMNVWSMRPDGTDLRQHTNETTYDVGGASVDGGRVVYQLGPDLWMQDLAGGASVRIPIALESDLDQTRERWITDAARDPSSVAVSPDADRIALTTRGRVFVVPAKAGRTVDVDPRSGVRYRDARFLDDTTLVAISDEWGELELVTLPANGVGEPKRLTTDGATLRWFTAPSPDGSRIAHTDKRQRLWVFDTARGTNTLVEENPVDTIESLTWSPDSRWLAYDAPAANMFRQVKIWSADGGEAIAATSDRYDSYRPQWSPDGSWLWFLSDRTLETTVRSPWGARAPEPHFEKVSKVYAVALKPGERWPFRPDDELMPKKSDDEEKRKDKPKAEGDGAADESAADGAKKPAPIEVVTEGIASRLYEVPMSAANLSGSPLLVTEKAIFWIEPSTESAAPDGDDGPRGGTLYGLAITSEKPKPKAVTTGVRAAQLSADRKKILLRKGNDWQVIDAKPEPVAEKADKGDRSTIDLSEITLLVSPRDEWRQMAIDAWRMLRDYFYDQDMHGVAWRDVLDKYLPWVDRVRSRDELNDLLQEMTGELAALHHFVRGEGRRGVERIEPGFLGADLERDDAAGGWRVTAIPTFDPDEPSTRPPLAALGVDVGVGDVIVAIDGAKALDAPQLSSLLRAKAGRQTLLRVKPKGGGEERDVIVVPVGARDEADLRYRGWELDRRALVEQLGAGELGYVHLRAMGGDDFSDFARDFYPVFNRKGLIVDVRANRGGNIDSWVLSRLMRRAWMYWNQHAGRAPSWNMQYAFRGPMVVLCDEHTASDGEAFTEGFRRLGLGDVIGTRTWGGEIWLSSSNRLVDGGLASAGEYGVFDENGVWIIEGRGVEPDIVVDNLPHATFLGDDAQLKAAIEHLQQRLREHPVEIPPVPPAPRKAASP